MAAKGRTTLGKRFALFLTVAMCSACSLGLNQPKVTAGRWFPSQQLAQIQRGMSVSEVRQIGGEPFETLRTPEGETWRYYMSVEQEEDVKLLGVIPLPSRRSIRDFEVVVSVRNGLVTDLVARDTRK